MKKHLRLWIPIAALAVLGIASALVGLASLVWPGKYLSSRAMESAYLWVPLALFAFAAAGLLVRETRQAFGAVALILLVSIAGAEAWLAARPSVPPFEAEIAVVASLATARGEKADVRPLERVVNDLRAKGVDAFPMNAVGSFLSQAGPGGEPPLQIGDTRVFPLAPVRNAELVYCNESGQWFTYSSDRYGFNNPDALWDQPTDLMVIGDSFASGACLEAPAKGALDLLRETVPRTISLASPSSGPLLQLAILKEYGVDRRPRRVLWLYSDHDILPFIQERQSPWLRAYLTPGHTNHLASYQDATDPLLRAVLDAAMSEEPKPAQRSLAATLRDSALLLHLRADRGLTSCPARDPAVLADLEETFKQAGETISSWGGELTIVYIPSSGSSCDLFAERLPEHSWLYGGSLRAFEAAELSVVDLRQDYEARGRPPEYFWFSGSHFTETGAEWFAEALVGSSESGVPSR